MTKADHSTLNYLGQKNRYNQTVVMLATALLFAFSSSKGLRNPVPNAVPSRPVFAVEGFPIEEVRLLPSLFQHAQQMDHDYILALDEQRLLRNFRVNAGIPTDAKPLGGWEAPDSEIRGHFVGHYLTACAKMYAATGDPKLKARAVDMIHALAQVQAKLGSSGYLSAFPESFFDRLEAGKAVWVPWYTIHKILEGILDVHRYCHDPEALTVATKLGNWVCWRIGRLSDAQLQQVLLTEQGGIAEAMANLYAATGNYKFMEASLRFDHRQLIVPFEHHIDNLTGKHANTQIPKFIGAARQYELTGSTDLKTAASFFWHEVALKRSYVIGGNSDYEYFTPINSMSQALVGNTTETCNTYNMIKLSRHLFTWHPTSLVGDFIERAEINHILASQNPATGMMCYYVPLSPGARKVYSTPYDSFWCCTGTGVENHARYNESIYFHGENSLYVELYTASTLNWKEKGIRVKQETRFPMSPTSTISFDVEKPSEFSVYLRKPYWLAGNATITVNGHPVHAEVTSNGFFKVNRTWHSGDALRITLPMAFHTQGFSDNPNELAIMYGPVVLASKVTDDKPAKANDLNNPFQNTGGGVQVPAIVTNASQITKDLRPVPGKPLEFKSVGDIFYNPGAKSGENKTFEPFYKVVDSHYSVYWHVYSHSQWKQAQKDYQAALERERALDARSEDHIQIGNQQSEVNHDLKSENSGSGEFGNRKYRDTGASGWFSYVVKVNPNQTEKLLVSYWGSDVDRTFDILVNGKVIATQTLQNNEPGKFFDVTYPLTTDILDGKTEATIEFRAHPGSIAGGIFDLRVLKN